MKFLNAFGFAGKPLLAGQSEIFLNGSDSLKPGRVEVKILPGRSGRVRFSGTTWPAKSTDLTLIEPGREVCVVGRRGTTLLVVPIESPLFKEGDEYATIYQ